MGACGDTQADMALALGISVPTLTKHYPEELAGGKAKANAAVKMSAYRQAVSGRFPVMTIFWLKTQCGWKDRSEIDVTSAGKPLGEMSADEIERKALEILARRSGDSGSVDSSTDPGLDA